MYEIAYFKFKIKAIALGLYADIGMSVLHLNPNVDLYFDVQGMIHDLMSNIM